MRETLQDKLNAQARQGLWRELHAREDAQSVYVTYDQQRYLNFNTNDYLGLSTHPDVLAAFQKGAARYGIGSGSANTLSGYTQAHDELAKNLAAWTQRDKAVLFTSGYLANLAVLTTLIVQDDKIFADKLNHASLMDGMRYSGAAFKRYPHLNLDKLATLLNEHTEGQAWVVTESLFSMDGDAPDLNRVVSLARSAQAHVIIDEAHSLGVYGVEGQGLVAASGLSQQDVPILIGTFGKSFGTQGAFVAGPNDWIEQLIQFARPYLFTTAMSPALACATNASLQLIQSGDAARAQLFDCVDTFKQRAAKSGWTVMPSSSPIQPIVFENIPSAQAMAEHLKAEGILVPCIRYPTVPKDSPRLRVTITAQHTHADIESLFNAMDKARHV